MNNLKTIREMVHKTQGEISDVLGVDIKTYRSYEQSGKMPSEYCVKLVEYYSELLPYKVSIDYLLGLPHVKTPFRETSLRDFVDNTHLSVETVHNILFEASKSGDNRYIQILDMILSDKQAYTSLMENIALLINPNTWCIDLKHPEPFVIESDFLQVSPELLKQMDDEMPDNVYKRMRNTMESFLKTIPQKIILSKNAFHPTLLYTVREEDIDNGKH